MAALVAFLWARTRRICSEWSMGEISGAMGDLGTLLPFIVALAKDGFISIGPALFFAGVFNVTSGVQWDMPMPVQPMKAIATVALTTSFLNSRSVLCAGILTAATVATLGLTRGIEFLHWIIPMPVVSGIQVGLGIRMIHKGFKLAGKTDTWIGIDSKLTGLIAVIATLSLRGNKRIPTALIVFIVGLIIAAVIVGTNGGGDGSFPNDGKSSPITWTLSDLTAEDWRDGFIHGTIPQVPLTTLNSVIAVTKLAHDLYPQRRSEISRVGVASAVGTMNLFGCALGAMPMCHGAGGLAAQHSFGARGGLSIVFLGFCKMLVALVFGGAAILSLLSEFPDAILGALLGISGLELAVSGFKGVNDFVHTTSDNDISRKFRPAALICLATAGTTVATGNTAIGCLAGLIVSIFESRAYKDIVSPSSTDIGEKKLQPQELREEQKVGSIGSVSIGGLPVESIIGSTGEGVEDIKTEQKMETIFVVANDS